MSYDYTDLTKQAAAPGLGSRIYMAPLSWIDSFGTFNDGDSNEPGASVIMDTPFIMKEGRGFIEFYSTQGASNFEGSSVGEEDSETMEYNVNLQHPGIKPAIAEFMKNARNEEWVLVVPSADCLDSTPWLIGTACSPVKLTFEVESGQPNSGSQAVRVTGKWFHPYPLFYSASIPLLDDSE